ncbi:MAG TPA: hypothetical protein VG604_03280 [Candidatus Saccharimonadales bacterium]|nr:hypothetical protein [Candidatus Saccharimonadales bacterium]
MREAGEQRQPTSYSVTALSLGWQALRYSTLPTRYAWSASRWLAAQTIRRFAYRGREQAERLRMLEPAHEFSMVAQTHIRAVDTDDEELLIFNHEAAVHATDRQRQYIVRIVAQDAARRHIKDADRPWHLPLEMSKERIEEFEDLLDRYHKPSETLEILGVDETLRPTLQHYYPHRWPNEFPPDNSA